MKLKIQLLGHYQGSNPPKYESPGASGMDIRAQLGYGKSVAVLPGQVAVVPTGIKVEIPLGYEIQVRPRSGWAIKKGMTVINSPGTIDSDYRGEILVGLINLSSETQTVEDQDRIAQLVVCPVVKCSWELVEDSLSSTARGEGRFGSTGFSEKAREPECGHPNHEIK